MKKLHELTPEQQLFASEHHDLVYRFLKRRGRDASEYYDVVIFGYLGAVQEYLESPELQQEVPFEAVAWTQMRSCLAKEYQYRNRAKRSAPMGTYHEEYATARLDDLLPNRMQAMAETLDDQKHLHRLLSCLTPKEKEVVYLKADGYTYREIAQYANISVYGVNSRFMRIRRKVRSLTLA